ncbi:hypothetical protein PoB_005176300 [Plakobranchus ocellatus]|uniref:Uncharacterized protein n=1 Tax=Plakobranchus ocellatus TaxID=259542 RepID=A0AAV4C2P1_9GAST|nr:hypothetical protein PoB_005176300 [Plakobranchus ocellatus]
MFAFTNRKKDVQERFWPVVDERSITGKRHHQVLNHSIASLNQPISLRDRVNPAAARQTLKYFWRPPDRLQSVFGSRHRDSRVFLAAAILTLDSLWSRVILACYTIHQVNMNKLLFSPSKQEIAGKRGTVASNSTLRSAGTLLSWSQKSCHKATKQPSVLLSVPRLRRVSISVSSKSGKPKHILLSSKFSSSSQASDKSHYCLTNEKRFQCKNNLAQEERKVIGLLETPQIVSRSTFCVDTIEESHSVESESDNWETNSFSSDDSSFCSEESDSEGDTSHELLHDEVRLHT